jgi:hypothetical protein
MVYNESSIGKTFFFSESRPMTKSEQQVSEFLTTTAKYGWTVSRVRGGVVEITKLIKPGCNESFVTADMEYYSILSMAPGKGGSIWGTDGGGIGGMVAMNTGRFVMKKSGVNKSFIKKLSQQVPGV